MEIRQLLGDDADQLRRLRIRATMEFPSAFSASAEEETALSVEQVAQQLADGPPHNFWFGAFEGGDLIGIVNLFCFQRRKVRHKAMLGNMYVLPDRHGRGVGRELLRRCIDHARAHGGIRAITLAVTAGNDHARRLYAGFGFVPYGIEPGYIRVDDTYHDIEWMLLDLR